MQEEGLKCAKETVIPLPVVVTIQSDVRVGEHAGFLDAQVVLVAFASFELGCDDAEVALLSLSVSCSQ